MRMANKKRDQRSQNPKGGAASKQGFGAWLWSWVKTLAIAFVLWYVLQALLIKSFRIDSGSMQPTLYGADAPLNLYDRVVADKLSYHFRAPLRFEVAISCAESSLAEHDLEAAGRSLTEARALLPHDPRLRDLERRIHDAGG